MKYNASLLDDAVEYLVKLWGTKKYPIPKEMEAPCMRLIRLPDLKKFPPVSGFTNVIILILSKIHYYLGNHVITPSDAVCDLGVNINLSLKPSFHISTIVRKANIRSKLILKCFLSCNPGNFISTFKV